jgi:drug/metabolite transporter (DMT)-like permease
MFSELGIAIAAGLGGMLGWGVADFFAKKTIDELGDIMTLAWAGVFGTIAFLAAVLYEVVAQGVRVDIPQDPRTWLALLFFGALQGAVYIFVYRGFAKGKVGLLSPLFASFSGIVALVSILFLGEAAGAYRVTALFVTFAGVFILNADFSAFSSLRIGFVKIAGFPDVAIGTLLAAAWTILWERFVNGGDWLFYAFYMFAFMTVAVFLFAFFRRLSFSVQRRGLWKFLAAIGICETVAYIAISLGYGVTPLVSVVSVLSAAFSLPTIILARIFLKERTTLTQTLGIAVIVIGVVLLAVV